LAGAIESTPTESGAYIVNRLLANITKQNVTRNLYEICRLAHDIAGGILATLPSEKDLNDPRYGRLIEKYMKSANQFPTIYRMKTLRLIEAMTGGTALVEAMHGAGSPQAQRVIMQRYANLDAKENLAKKILDIE
jgi:4-hydroxybutyryl-CoA dehydratase/vinylacetyl-CoA-Delta-isomerase